MKKFSIEIRRNSSIYYNHYLGDEFIKERECYDDFKERYPLLCSSRRFDKPARKYKNGTCIWKLDGKYHREGKPAVIWVDVSIEYWENGEEVK